MPFATTSDGTRLFWREEGSGSPLLLIQGFGYASDMWYRIVPALAERHRVLAFDNRGVGKSDAPPGPYSIAMMADDALAVLDSAGADRAHVFGISMGGMIAQELALRNPGRVRSLVLGCTHCGGSKVFAAEPAAIEALLARVSMPPEQGARHMIPFVYDETTPRDRIEQDVAVRMRGYPAAASSEAQAAGIFSWAGTYERLSSLAMPTLVLHGETDRLVPAENARILAGAIPGAKLVVLPRASHVFWTDQPEATMEVLRDFLGREVS
jgi:pimeloyl-ACP methyl ester carboxylesterase